MTEKGKIRSFGKGRIQPTAPFRGEIEGGGRCMSFLLSGINSIRDFSSSSVLLRCRGFLIGIRGESLSLSVYENKTVEIVGKIHGMEFVYDKG